MSLSRLLRTIRIVGIGFTLLGDLLVVAGKILRGSNLDSRSFDQPGPQVHVQDPLSHGEENEKPEQEVQSEFDFEDDSFESDRRR